jgi:alkanesulfonate monooxygenase SsuD/methylene tetrahydromethanopterin reductase-like flavin-dependent oxidoreductase (luciferase family)
LTFEGKHYQFRNVPMILRPVQRPHPPLWYGTTIPENADWPAANDVEHRHHCTASDGARDH